MREKEFHIDECQYKGKLIGNIDVNVEYGYSGSSHDEVILDWFEVHHKDKDISMSLDVATLEWIEEDLGEQVFEDYMDDCVGEADRLYDEWRDDG